MTNTEFPNVRFNKKAYIPRKLKDKPHQGIEYPEGWEGKIPRDVYITAKELGVIDVIEMGPQAGEEAPSTSSDASSGEKPGKASTGKIR